MEDLPPTRTVVPEQAEVEERREDEGKNARSKASNESKTELEARYADGHAPRDENEDGTETADHEVTHHTVTNTLYM